jgi:glycosyltransferase 2 family protein
MSKQATRARRPWRSIVFAPIGDGQTRRRGRDVFRVASAFVVVVICWLANRANSHPEHVVATTMSSAPNGIRWLITAIWWAGSIGIIVLTAALALASRRWSAVRDVGMACAISLACCGVLVALYGSTGGRPPDPSLDNFDLHFPVIQVAVTVAAALAATPYFSRWLQRGIAAGIGLLALAAVVNGSGLPVAVLASLAIGWGSVAIVHLIVGSPLGLPSAQELVVLLGDLGIQVDQVVPDQDQEWGVGRFSGVIDGKAAEVSVYGRDDSDAQLLAKTGRFLFYRDSGPTLSITRRQQVEHEAYLTLMADRAGARVPAVLAAGPAGPARDALLVTQPPNGNRLSTFAPFVPPSDDAPSDGNPPDAAASDAAGSDAAASDAAASDAAASDGAASDGAASDAAAPPPGPEISDAAVDDVFRQLMALRDAGIAHGSLSTHTILADDAGHAGFVDFRYASTVALPDQLDRDTAAALAAVAEVVGPDRAIESAHRLVTPAALVAALPFLQRAALGSAGRSMRGKKSSLSALRERGAAAAGVDVPKLIEPRRISWVTLVLVLGTLIGGWALIGVLINVTKSWSTIKGADWAWVALVFVLAQAAYPAIAITTVGSVTNPLPYGRTLALEVSDTFVALAGGSMAVLATRVRFFQQEGYSPTVAVSSGVLVSTASWIVKGALFLIAIPIALSNFHFSEPSDSSGGHQNLVWLIVIAVVLAGVAAGLVLAVPRWRRLATAKLRPKASEVWEHLRLLAQHPRNLVEIFGGNVVAQIVVALALGAALHAFGQHLGLATLIIVLTLGSMLGGISPVPGGMGVVEAGMIIGLTAAGISETDAVAAVFVQRLFTAYLPPIWGWFVLVWMRKKEYL